MIRHPLPAQLFEVGLSKPSVGGCDAARVRNEVRELAALRHDDGNRLIQDELNVAKQLL
jgi:hypothetical protein